MILSGKEVDKLKFIANFVLGFTQVWNRFLNSFKGINIPEIIGSLSAGIIVSLIIMVIVLLLLAFVIALSTGIINFIKNRRNK